MAYRVKMTMADGTAATLVQTEHDWKTKMAGIPSFSTCCLLNPACIARMRNGESVCAHCFSAAIQKFRQGVKLTTSQNYVTLNSQEIAVAPKVHWTENALKINPHKLSRIESWGDVASVLQALNYIKLVYENPDCRWAAWSKNTWFWVQAFRKVGKPKNLKFIKSSLRVNEIEPLKDWEIPWVDRRFTVCTKEWLDANGLKSNCAGIRCVTCEDCYCGAAEFDALEILR